MKRNLITLIPIFLLCVVATARPRKIHVKTPGTLAELVGQKYKFTTREIKLSGTLNGTDLCFLREMAGSDINQQPTKGILRTIDMTDVTFTQGGGPYIDKEGLKYVTGGKHTLPPFTFRNCPIEKLILPSRLDSIQIGALEYTCLSRIELPDSIWIGNYAFNCNPKLQEIVFPDHVSNIGVHAFRQSAIKHISANNVDNICGSAFQDIPFVETIEFKGYVGHMDGYYTFSSCPQLRSVDLCGPVVTTGGSIMMADCPLLSRFAFHDVVFATYAGKAPGCPAFKGYDVRNTVILSGDTTLLPAMSDDGNKIPKNEKYHAAMQKLLPILTQAGRRGKTYYMHELGNSAYDEACWEALHGNKDNALDWLDLAVVGEFNYYSHMKNDSDLVSLHGDPRFEAILNKVREMGDFQLLLKQSAPYCKNESEWPAFTYQPASDSNLVRVREYFNLDSIAGSGDDISKMKNIMYWLHDAIRHDGSSSWPDCPFNTISLYELCKREGRGLNCRFLAMMLNEFYLACGIPSRYLTCQSKAWKTDNDCHVINMAWSKSLNKWVWMDASFAAFVADENGRLLHPGEVRERLIKDLPLVLNDDANWNHKEKQTVENYLKTYMAKNLYFMSARIHSQYQPEGEGGGNSRMIYLAPKGFLNFDNATADDTYFWQAPQM